MSKLRGIRSLTRRDKEAVEKIRRGALTWTDLRFVTLTGVGDFRKNFRKLKYYLRSMMKNFEYFGVRTTEGQLGVVHLVYAGKSVRYGDLSKKWSQISGYWNVSISKVTDLKGIVDEITRQHGSLRYFSSRGWLPKQSCQQKFDGSLSTSIYRETKFKFIS